MDLKEFLTDTLLAIQEGGQDAIRRRGENSEAVGAINPVWRGSDHDWEKYVQKVEFDVALTVSDKAGASGKGGIKVFSVELGGEGSKAHEQSTVSRVKFTVPIVPPAQTVDRS